jgi:hypothetical protein
MKLKMHSFDFEECTLTFSVPKEIMHGNSFGNVPGGVKVDLVAITNNAALGAVEAKPEQHTTRAITPPEQRDCDTCANDGECYVTMLQCKGYVRAAQ